MCFGRCCGTGQREESLELTDIFLLHSGVYCPEVSESAESERRSAKPLGFLPAELKQPVSVGTQLEDTPLSSPVGCVMRLGIHTGLSLVKVNMRKP